MRSGVSFYRKNKKNNERQEKKAMKGWFLQITKFCQWHESLVMNRLDSVTFQAEYLQWCQALQGCCSYFFDVIMIENQI